MRCLLFILSVGTALICNGQSSERSTEATKFIAELLITFQSPEEKWNTDSILKLIPKDTLKDRNYNSPQGQLRGEMTQPRINMSTVTHYKITKTNTLDSLQTLFLVEVRFYDACNPYTPNEIDSTKYYVRVYKLFYDGLNFKIIPGLLVENCWLNLEYYFESCETGPKHKLETAILEHHVDDSIYHR